MWELDCEESWTLRNWCFWTVVLGKTLESHLDCKEIQPVHSKGDQSWVFFGRNDVKAETPVLWPPHAKSWLIGKDSDAGRDWQQEEKGMTEDEMAGWHHWLNGRESEWTLGVGDGQGGLVCCDSWDHKESDTTERLNWTELNWGYIGLPWWLSGKESTCQWRRHRLDLWVGKIPWRRVWQPTPVFLPGVIPWTEEPGELQSMGSQRIRHDLATKHYTLHILHHLKVHMKIAFVKPFQCLHMQSSVQVIRMLLLHLLGCSYYMC